MKLHAPYPRHHQTAHIQIDLRACRACWSCIDACPRQVLGQTPLKFHKHVHVDHAGRCKGCGACVRACPQGAITPRTASARS